jgi:hypothetical protein
LSGRGDIGHNDFVLQLAQTPSPLSKPVYELPPLILHPISRSGEALPERPSNAEGQRAEAGRVELRMLCCLGKDLNRWLEQCLECGDGDLTLSVGELMDLLVDDPPESVSQKMLAWGVIEFRHIFARALGLSTIFPNPPAREQVSDTFARDFARYADVLYRTRRTSVPPAGPSMRGFHFEVYASGEYAKLLEQSWGL